MYPIKTPISLSKLIYMAILILSSVIITPIEIKAATTEQRIALLPIDTSKAGNFAYLGPAIEELLNSRLYKPGIIGVISPSDMAGGAENRKAESITAMKDKARDLGAKYFITGEVSSDGKTPGLTLRLMETSASKPIRSLSIKNALVDDVLTKIDGFIAETADAIVTGPQSVAETPPQHSDIHSNASPTIKPTEQDTPQKPEVVENNAIAIARIHPDYLFYEKLDEITGEKDNTTASPAKSKVETNRSERDAKEAKEAYENVLPYPAPSQTSESSKEVGNTNEHKNAQLAASLKKATKKDGVKAPRITSSSKIPYPTPEEIEARAASAANAIPEMPPASIIKTPERPQAQVQTPHQQGETKEGWLSWILKPFKAKKQNEAQALNKPALPKEKDRAVPPSKNIKPDTTSTTTVSDGPIWQWY
ncbi:MAG: hypothetical protein ACUVQ2_06335 [Dissulfurimicrobium sp.]|uniref:hypothetical protein n=1 Tax=Dissulfurimicrobium sp. TaxID=2022436 RepID=UPI004049CE34